MVVYQINNINIEGKLCLGDLVKDGLVKTYIDNNKIKWENISDKTFPVHKNICKDGKCFSIIHEFKPGEIL